MDVIRSAAERRAATAARLAEAAKVSEEARLASSDDTDGTSGTAAMGGTAGMVRATSPTPRRKGGRPRRDTLAARHEDILAIALGLFIEHGYANVTLAMLAASARMAVRTIYVKFGNKEGLLAAMVDAERDRHHAQLAQLVLDGLPFRERLSLLAQHIARRGSEQRLLYLQAILLAEGDEALARRFYDAAPGMALAQLHSAMEDGLRLGAIRPGLTPALLCEFFISCIVGNRTTLWQPAAHEAGRWQLGLGLFFSATAIERQ